MREGAKIRSHETLQGAILSAFTSASNDEIGARLRRFDERAWKRLGTWLHASGLALYFLEELRVRELLGAVPGAVVDGLQQNQFDNRERTESLIEEFIRLNSSFRDEGLDCLNVKGFSLGAEYCANPALRSQFDLDFWCSEDAAVQCKTLMQRLGYMLVADAPGTLEFQSGESAYPKLGDFYKVRAQKAVEIHLRPAGEMASIPRENGLLRSFVFPTLSQVQAFLLHARHLAKHLRSEWTRASWMLELSRAIEAHREDETFWNKVREQAVVQGNAAEVGIAVLATAKVFSFSPPEGLNAITVDRLPEGVVRWIDAYAEHAITAAFPGSKVYLLLERELTTDKKRFRRQRRSVLFPIRLPGNIAAPAGPRGRSRGWRSHAYYLGFRLAFHVREGWRFARAERQWSESVNVLDGCVVGEGGSIA